MKSVISREKLIDVVTKSREDHIKIYEEARAEYLKKVREGITAVAEKFEATQQLDLTALHLTQPQNFVTEYDEALEMLNYTEESSIALEEDDFRKFVLDKWSWGRQFFASNSAYVAGTTALTLASKTK